ncbi:TonB-dependent receptor [Candidatus Sulfotelmatomonas gaucii]|uniref:TonB-dependent receptor n=1 Tax=Candidatus Sulfuritelmatomonas gaucii TaxID=2043161 RepID=A0A2N9LFK6_9BACT|nr:TonB-dependent receptor [Candidatus Sulfotelmatomonas gaucii]
MLLLCDRICCALRNTRSRSIDTEVFPLMRRCFAVAALLLAASLPAFATVFATVRGIVHDPQHRPIAGAEVTLEAAGSAFVLHATTQADGEFTLPEAPLGVYRLTAVAKDFETATQTLTVESGTNPILHIPLALGGATESVVVRGTAGSVDTVTPTTLITRETIDETPGAIRTTGMEMITDYVPGAYMTHDMLHMRGGHQTSWLIDGVQIPNTKIASNVGPQIDPKDIDSLETERGSYGADVGDRTYGVFDVLPRNGFEFDREGELMLYGGNPYDGEAQLSLGNHSERSAWYASTTGSRSNYGLATPVIAIDHDATNSESGFVSLIRNQTAKDQLRVDGQARQDYFQVPYDPNKTDYDCAGPHPYYCSWGLRDAQRERDAFVIANWVHTISPRALLSVAPFYHFNQSDFDSQSSDYPAATTWLQGSNYVGVQADAHLDAGWNSFSGGLYSFFQRENDLFGVRVNDGSGPSQPNTPANEDAGLLEFYLADHLRLGQNVTLLGGERFTIDRAELNEKAIYPRIGATVRIPRLNWVLRGFYGHYFQPAPILTVSSSVLNYASSLPGGQNTFTPLPSERDEEDQFGIEVPYRGWKLDVDTFKNRVNNFLDHSNLGESNMYFPIAVDGALMRGWEMTLRSPELWRHGQFHAAYSNQIAEQRGDIIGGFTCSIATDSACDLGPQYIPLDHDQRNTLNTGFTANLPLKTWFATNVYYGSGFTNGLAGAHEGPYDGSYLPAHTTFDASVGHGIGERWKLSATAINVTNHRVLLDNSVTIGGFHWNDPRMFAVEARYRFKF